MKDQEYKQGYEGPLGMRRPFGIGPMTKRRFDLSQVSTTREEFVEKCMEGRAAKSFSEDFIRSIVDDEETARDIIEGKADEELKRNWCEGLADTLGF